MGQRNGAMRWTLKRWVLRQCSGTMHMHTQQMASVTSSPECSKSLEEIYKHSGQTALRLIGIVGSIPAMKNSESLYH